MAAGSRGSGARGSGVRVGLVKAHVVSPTSARSAIEQQLAGQEAGKSIEGVLDPPLDVDRLIVLWQMSAHVPPCVAAMVTNVDSFGHRFDPAVDLDAPTAPARVRAAMLLDRLHAAAREAGLDLDAAPPARSAPGNGVPDARSFPEEVLPDPDTRLAVLERLDVAEPTDDEVRGRMEALRRLSRLELARVRSFFEFCCPGSSFIMLRRRLRLDLEVTGNAWVEVLRNKAEQPARLVRVPPAQMRLAPLDAEPTRIEELVRVSDLDWERAVQYRHFRRCAQVENNQVVTYYREFGDPRVVSRKTGKAYTDEEALRREEPSAALASEILHLVIPHPGSPYGAPRWQGNLPAVLGSRELDENNYDFFQSSSVPPLAIVVSGGTMRRNFVQTVEDFFVNQVRGRGSTHKVVVLEAEPGRAGGTLGHVPRIQFVHLREAQQQDATFQAYDDRNADKIGASFRLPRILVGRDRALNRSVAEAAIRLAEDQVFAGERAEFDDVVNRQILPALGVTFWRFVSNAPVTHDAATVAAVVGAFARAGAISANEARALASGLFNREFPPWPHRWADQPLPLTIVQLQQPELAARLMQDALGDLEALRPTQDVESVGPDQGERSAPAPAPGPAAPPFGSPIRPLGEPEGPPS